MTFDKLNAKFNLPEVVPDDEETDVSSDTSPTPLETPVDRDDIADARDALRNSIKKSEEILTELINIGKQNQSARTFEVAIQASRAMADGAMQLLKTHEQDRKGTKAIAGPKNMNVFVGSTKELMRAIKAAESHEVPDAEFSVIEE
jgi:hypothetical protein